MGTLPLDAWRVRQVDRRDNLQRLLPFTFLLLPPGGMRHPLPWLHTSTEAIRPMTLVGIPARAHGNRQHADTKI